MPFLPAPPGMFPCRLWHRGRPLRGTSEVHRYTEARGNLDKAGWCVDCVLTHCMPTSIALQMNRHNESDRLTDFLEEVRRKCRFAYWFGGHYHRNQIIDTRYVIEICDPSVPEDLDGPS